MVGYSWRGWFTNAELNVLHAEGFGHRLLDADWQGHSMSLVVLTHRVPGSVHAGDPPYTFVTDGIGQAVERARA